MTVHDMMKMMEKERHMALLPDSVDVVTTSGHVVDASESIAMYANSCVSIAVMPTVSTTAAECRAD